MENSLAILMTCHNRKEKTLNCLQHLLCSISASSYLLNFRVDIFLVDDGSMDGTSEAVKIQYPLVNIIQGNGELYWNRGMRLAWETAATTYDYSFYLWLNDDTIVFENTVEILIKKALVDKEKTLLIGATKSEISGKITYSAYKVSGEKILPNGEWQNCCFFNGNIVLVPRRIFNEVGNLDPKYRHSFGDFDYGYMVHSKKYELLLSPAALGVCEENTSKAKWLNKAYPLVDRLKFLYSPLGNNPFELLHINLKQQKWISGFIQFVNIHLKTIFLVNKRYDF